MKSILDRSFHYTPSAETDLRKTFARIRREQRKRTGTDEARTPIAVETGMKIVPIRRSS